MRIQQISFKNRQKTFADYKKSRSVCPYNINVNRTTAAAASDTQKNGNLSFGNGAVRDLLHEKLLSFHKLQINNLDPKLVEGYFQQLGIPCTIRNCSQKAKQMIAYGCFHVAEIFRQINHHTIVLPPKIDVEELIIKEDGKEIFPIAVCYFAPSLKKNYPIRTVTFNSLYDWENHIPKFEKAYKESNGFLSSGHFLQPFLHEFGHNVHSHHLYSKFGTPYPNTQYLYNPSARKIMEALNYEIFDSFGNPIKNDFITMPARNALQHTSKYGRTLLPELFAEEFAKCIVDSIDAKTLRLTKYPWLKTEHPDLDAVLYETWEGLIADGQGYIS